MSRYRVFIVVALLLLFIGGAIGYFVFPTGVRVTLRNTGQEMIRDVTIQVTGGVYSHGDLTPGSSLTQRAFPTDESIVEVEFTDEQGRRVRFNAGSYLEAGARGRMDIEIGDGKIIAVKDEATGVSY